ncbi:glycosyltransferase family 32 protein [Trichocladium antarcticum]|uniref:Glycosyltransferase family 32 protein n=1 Tax=Trichocladium antarcticum TaxID=1450529 RepID=A0AAN6ZF25_9PEZI|nr:glycosyltransferase family 32 protein [Trichocladium antarcticum]
MSPLSSPTLSTLPGKLRNRLPTQMRRTIPVYLVCVTLFILVFRAQVLPAPQHQSSLLKRQAPQKHLGGAEEASQPTDFPKKIWQSWKVDPLNFEKRDFDTARTWTTKNPGHRYEVLTDHNDVVYVEEKFGPQGFNRPDIVEFYRTVNATIIKADLLRYMIMYAEGGVYADIDVEALKPVDRFIPARYNAADIDMVIGVEIDQPEFRDHSILGPKSMSFCQWTFMCRPRLPVMLQLVENIMSWLSDIAAKQNVAVSEVALDFDEVIGGTGPSAFTAAVLKEMNKHVGSGAKITWDAFHAIDESTVVSRVLVLDVEKFAAGQGHSDSGNHNARGALVKHHYHASNWPSKHPRFSHPAYGEVEHCNWDPVCVKQWDDDVAAWKALSQTEQNKILEAREQEHNFGLDLGGKEHEKAQALERLTEAVRRQEEEARKLAEGGGVPLADGNDPGQAAPHAFPAEPLSPPLQLPPAPAPAPEPRGLFLPGPFPQQPEPLVFPAAQF